MKLFPLLKALTEDRSYEILLCSTNQQENLLTNALAEFSISPHFSLETNENKSLSSVTSSILDQATRIVKTVKPNLIVVQGDTTTTFAGAMSGFFERIPVAHLEAGLRTYDLSSPFPEEMFRRQISTIASLNLCPTQVAKNNLVNERAGGIIEVVGNTAIDTLTTIFKENKSALLPKSLESKIDSSSKIVFVTCHRRENFGSGVTRVTDAINQLAKRHKNISFIFSVHSNPSVSSIVNAKLEKTKGVHLSESLSYRDTQNILRLSSLVLTDSGGIQEEVPSYGVKTLILRNATERKECLKAGIVELIDTRRNVLIEKCEEFLLDATSFESRGLNTLFENPFGDGFSSIYSRNHINTLLEVN